MSAALALVLIGFSVSGSATTISLIPSEMNINQDGSVLVDVVVSGLGYDSAPSLGVFDLDVLYDPGILSITNVEFGNQLDIFGLGSYQSVSEPSAGNLNLFELSYDFAEDLDLYQLDTFSLAALTFSSVAPGFSDITLGINSFGDSNGDPLVVDSLNSASINVSPVPLPGTFGLFVLGLGGLLFSRLYQRRKCTSALELG